MSKKNRIHIKNRQVQKTRLKYIIAAGSVASALTLILLVYFQFSNRIEMKASDINISDESLPTQTSYQQPVILDQDTAMRFGTRFKLAKTVENTLR